MKKLLKCIGILILGVILLSSVIVNASDKVNKENSRALNDVKKMISENKFDSVKKVEVDEKGQVKLATEIEEKDSKTNFQNGTYVFDRFDGWIRGKDVGFLKSIIIPAGATGELQKVEYSEFVATVSTNTSLEFGFPFVKAAVTVAYGEGAGEGKEITVRNNRTATNEDIFYKAQTVYRKYEIVEFKNGKIINHGTAYNPVSYVTESLSFKAGTKVDQKKLYEREDRNILGDPGYDYKPVVIPRIDYTESLGNVDPYQTWPRRTGGYYKGATLGAYFTVTHDGTYNIKETVNLFNAININPYAQGASMRLYKVDSRNSILAEIAYKPSNIETYDSYIDFIGEPLEANLRKGEKYLLVLNENKENYWGHSGNIMSNFEFSLK